MYKQKVSPINDRDVMEKLDDLEVKINKVSSNIYLYLLSAFGFGLGAFSLALFTFKEENIFLIISALGIIMMLASIFGLYQSK